MTTLMYGDFKLGDLVEVLDREGRPAGWGEILEFDTSTGRATIQRHSVTDGDRLSRETEKSTVFIHRLRKTNRERLGLAGMDAAQLAALSDREFVCLARGEDPGPPSGMADLAGPSDESFVNRMREIRGKEPLPDEGAADLSAGRPGGSRRAEESPEQQVELIFSRLLRRSGLRAADLSQPVAADRLTDEQFLRRLEDQRSGESARRRGVVGALRQEAERLWWPLAAHKRGEVLSRPDAERLAELDLI